jgi:chromosome segregation ATPase
MSHTDIKQSLELLQAEVNKLDTSDETAKAKLLSLIADVETQLQQPDSTEHKAANLNNLPSLIEQFESDHPQVTTVLGRLLTTLSGMGV